MSDESGFAKQMKVAVLVVMGSLPGKVRSVDQRGVITNALAQISVNGDNEEEARRLIQELVEKSPRSSGVARQSGFWPIVRTFLNDEEAVKAYLQSFPLSLSAQQRRSIVRYLVVEQGFNSELVDSCLAFFSERRRPTPSRGSGRRYAGFVR